MRHNPKHADTDPATVRRLIAANPWATIVSQSSAGLVASRYPVLLDEDSDDLAVYTHVGRPDQEFGARLARGTVGIRLPITRFVCKVKMSQDKDDQSQRQVLAALRRPGPYASAALADEMEAVRAEHPR